MKPHSRVRLCLEQLEDRWCPAVSASATNGVLLVTGSATTAGGLIAVKETAANTFEVDDSGTAVSGSPFTGVNSVKISLTSADDTLSVDLGGNTLTGNLYVNLGGGTNSATVVNGTVGGYLNVYGGSGTDTVTLGDGTNALSVTKSAYVNLNGAGNDVLDVKGAVTLSSYLTAYYVNTITLESGSDVKDDVLIFGGNSGNTVNLNGTIEESVAFVSYLFGSTAGNTLNVNGTVDGGVVFYGSNKADTLSIAGSVGRGVAAYMGGGDDTVSLTSTGFITGSLYVDGGAGADTVNLGGTVGKYTTIYGGTGDDKVTLQSTGHLVGAATISLQGGDDTFTREAGATFDSTLVVSGGSNGTTGDTYVGSTAGVTQTGFENFL